MSNPQGDIDKLVQSLYGIISPYSASIANTAVRLALLLLISLKLLSLIRLYVARSRQGKG